MRTSRNSLPLFAMSCAVAILCTFCADQKSMFVPVGEAKTILVPSPATVRPYTVILLEVNIGNAGPLAEHEVATIIETRLREYLRDRHLQCQVTSDPHSESLRSPYAVLAFERGNASTSYAPATIRTGNATVTGSTATADLTVTAILRGDNAPAQPLWKAEASATTSAGWTAKDMWTRVCSKVAEEIAERLAGDGQLR